MIEMIIVMSYIAVIITASLISIATMIEIVKSLMSPKSHRGNRTD